MKDEAWKRERRLGALVANRSSPRPPLLGFILRGDFVHRAREGQVPFGDASLGVRGAEDRHIRVLDEQIRVVVLVMLEAVVEVQVVFRVVVVVPEAVEVPVVDRKVLLLPQAVVEVRMVDRKVLVVPQAVVEVQVLKDVQVVMVVHSLNFQVMQQLLAVEFHV